MVHWTAATQARRHGWRLFRGLGKVGQGRPTQGGMPMPARLLTAIFLLMCVSCFDSSTPAPAGRFEKHMLLIAQSYESYPLVQNQARWAPWACGPVPAYNGILRFPGPPPDGDLHVSNSSDSQ